MALGVRIFVILKGPTKSGENFLCGLFASTSGNNCLVETRTFAPTLNCGGSRGGSDVVNCLSAADSKAELAVATAARQESNVGGPVSGAVGVSSSGCARG